jgi:hypothetical protein
MLPNTLPRFSYWSHKAIRVRTDNVKWEAVINLLLLPHFGWLISLDLALRKCRSALNPLLTLSQFGLVRTAPGLRALKDFTALLSWRTTTQLGHPFALRQSTAQPQDYQVICAKLKEYMNP